jgi:hypothetical protein
MGYSFILLIDKVMIDAHDDPTNRDYDSNAKTGKFVMLDEDSEGSDENALDKMLLSDGGADLENQMGFSIQKDLRGINKKVSISFTGDI